MTTLDPWLAKIARTISKYGWAVQGVLPDAENTKPGFGYTVGLSDLGLPELYIVGIHHQTAAAILNDIAQKMLDNDCAFLHGAVLHDVVAGLPVTLCDITDMRGAEMTMALLWAKALEQPVTALHVVWTDTNVYYPWEKEYDINPIIQPLTYTKTP